MTWYRSLYWRIAVGFIACLALLLVVQGMLFLWMMTRGAASVPNQPPDRLAQTIAGDVADALTRDASLDVDAYVRQEYASDSQPFLVLLADGRLLEVGATFPDGLKAEARERAEAMKRIDPERLLRRPPFGGRGFRGDGPGPRFGGPDGLPPPDARDDRPDDERRGGGGMPGFDGAPVMRGPGDPGPDGPGARGPFGDGRGGPPGFRIGRPSPIVANGAFVGLVVVPPQPPFMFLLTRYAPTLGTVAAATLVVGGVLAAFVIFGPTRRRLRELEDAARRLGGGDLSARAPATGNDEVTAVATAFNAMASDLAARTDALVNADRMRRQLLADLSHELNTPVTAMRGYLETLSMPEMGLDEATRARYLSIVGDENARLERLIGELLDLARLEGGGGSLRMEAVQVSDLFARVRGRHERAAAAAGSTLETSIAPGAAVVSVDRVRLEQALENLAANALRHAPRGTAVRLDASTDASGITIVVSDAGPGIPPEHIGRIFDRFYKADESRVAAPGGQGGSGLGLSIVKAIVERHGASIAVTSAPGRTAFTITGLARG